MFYPWTAGGLGLLLQLSVGRWRCDVPTCKRMVEYDGSAEALFNMRRRNVHRRWLLFTRGLLDQLFSFIITSRSTYTAATRHLSANVRCFNLRRQDVVKLGTSMLRTLLIPPESARCPVCGPNPEFIVIDGQALGCSDPEDAQPQRLDVECPVLDIPATKLCVVEDAGCRASINKILRSSASLSEAQAQLMRKWYLEMVVHGRPTVEGAAAYLFFHFFPIGTNERGGTRAGVLAKASPQHGVSAKADSSRNEGVSVAAAASEMSRLERALRRGADGELALGGAGSPVAKATDTWRDRTGICAPNFGLYARDNDGVWLAVLPFLQALLAETVSGMFQAHDERAVRLLANTMRLKPARAWRRLTAAVDGVGFIASFLGQMASAVDGDKRLRVAVGQLLRAAVDVETTIDEMFNKVASSDESRARGRCNFEYCSSWKHVPSPADYRRWRAAQHALVESSSCDPLLSYEFFAALERVRPGIKDSEAAKRRVGYRGKDRHTADMEGDADACNKAFSIKCGLTQGVFNVVCPHVITLGFRCLFRAESVGEALSIVLERFPRLPKVIFYDVACKLDKNALRRVRPILRAHGVRCILDRPHSITHTCSPVYMPDESLGATAGVATQAAEVSHSIAAANRTCLAYMSPPTYMVHKMVQVAMMNVRKIHRMSQANDGGENDHVPLSPFYHSRLSRVCQRGSACSCQASVAVSGRRDSEGALLVKMAGLGPEVDCADGEAPASSQGVDARAAAQGDSQPDASFLHKLPSGCEPVPSTIGGDCDPRDGGGDPGAPRDEKLGTSSGALVSPDEDEIALSTAADLAKQAGQPRALYHSASVRGDVESGDSGAGHPPPSLDGSGQPVSSRRRSTFSPLDTTQLTEMDANLVKSFTTVERLAFPVRAENKARTVLMGMDFLTLCGEQWLNDEVMNSFVALVNHRDGVSRSLSVGGGDCTNSSLDSSPATASRRAFMFNTFFFSRLLQRGGHYDYQGVQNWGRKRQLRLDDVDVIIIPMHVSSDHWVLSVIDVQKRNVLFYDPLFSVEHKPLVSHLLHWLHDEARQRLGAAVAAEWDILAWPVVCDDALPVQKDGSSCGVFTLAVADCVALGVPASFGQRDVPVLRQRLALALYHDDLAALSHS